MSRFASSFALDQLFMHGHFVSPAALMASGLLEEPSGKREPTASPKPQAEPAERRKHQAHDPRWVHA